MSDRLAERSPSDPGRPRAERVSGDAVHRAASFWEASSQPVAVDGRGRARRERAGLLFVLTMLVVLVLAAGAGYVGVHVAVGDRVPRGTEISGVDVGGLTRDAAIAKLDQAFAARARRPILLSAADATGAERTVSIRPDRIGLQVDAVASVDATGGASSWSPGRLWSYFSDDAHRDAVVSVDPTLLTDRIRAMSGALSVTPVDGRVVFTSHGVRAVNGQAGDAIALADAQQAIEDAFLAGLQRAQVPIQAAQPDISRADVEDAVDGFARTAMSGPVVLRFGAKELRLPPRSFATALSMVPSDGVLVPRVSAARVLKLVGPVRATTSAQDATVRLVDGVPQVIHGRAGLTFDDDAVVAAFTKAVAAHGSARTVTVAAHAAQPEVTASQARGYGVKQRVATYSSYFSATGTDADRVAADVRRLDQRLVPPGGSLLVGAGTGPVARAAFGAAFFGGLTALDPSRPITLGASSSTQATEVRFRNDSPYAVLVHVAERPARAGRPGAVKVVLWSTKTWDVTATKGARTDPVAPPTHTGIGAGCRPSKGAAGYTVAVTRVFRKVGDAEVDHTESFTAVTAPTPRRVCQR